MSTRKRNKTRTKRPNGTGSIFALKDGGFRVSLTMDVRVDGRIQRKTVQRRAKTKAIANRKLAELQDMARNQALSAGEITVSQWIDQWLKLKADSCRPKTLDNYRSRIEVFRDWFGTSRLAKLDILQLREMFRDQPSEYARFDLKRKVKSCLQQAVFDKRLSDNPMAGEKMQKPRPRKDPFTSEERFAICKASEDSGHRLHAMFCLALFMGPRIGELFALRWQDWRGTELHIVRQISEHSGKLEVYDPKNQSARTLDLPVQMQKVLADRKRLAKKEGNARCQWMFPSAAGTLQRKSNFYRRHWKKVLTAAGVRYRNFHQTRHTAIVHMLATETVQAVAQMAGHRNVETTLRSYSSYLPEHRKGVSESVAKMMSEMSTNGKEESCQSST